VRREKQQTSSDGRAKNVDVLLSCDVSSPRSVSARGFQKPRRNSEMASCGQGKLADAEKESLKPGNFCWHRKSCRKQRDIPAVGLPDLEKPDSRPI
jgi:hypothetical protein